MEKNVIGKFECKCCICGEDFKKEAAKTGTVCLCANEDQYQEICPECDLRLQDNIVITERPGRYIFLSRRLSEEVRRIINYEGRKIPDVCVMDDGAINIILNSIDYEQL